MHCVLIRQGICGQFLWSGAKVVVVKVQPAILRFLSSKFAYEWRKVNLNGQIFIEICRTTDAFDGIGGAGQLATIEF